MSQAHPRSTLLTKNYGKELAKDDKLGLETRQKKVTQERSFPSDTEYGSRKVVQDRRIPPTYGAIQ